MPFLKSFSFILKTKEYNCKTKNANELRKANQIWVD